MKERDEIKVGVVGLGKMGLLHASILSKIPQVQLAVLCDKSLIMRKFAKNVLKKPLVTDRLEDMTKLGLDAVYVTTPIPSHYNIIKYVYKDVASNVFSEKTLTSSYAQSEELCRLSKSKGVSMVGYMKRFSVTFRAAKDLIDNGSLGSLLSFEAHAYSSDFFGVERTNMPSARGGVLEDLGSHVLDLSMWFFNDKMPSARVLSCSLTRNDAAQFEVVSGDFFGKFDISWVKDGYRMPEFVLYIKGTNGWIRVDDNQLETHLNNSAPKKLYRHDLNDYVPFYLGDSEYYREDLHFINAVRSQTIPESTFDSAKRVDFLIEQVKREADE